jgi:DNA-binding response OmpR family regulator
MDKPTKILIVDDDPFILDMYILKFKEKGFEVDTARDGKTALEKINSFNPDVLLLDLVLPMLDGFEVLEELKKRGSVPRAKTIILTNLGQKEDVERGMNLGAHDYIIKAHFTPSEVVEKVKSVLGK